MHHPFLVQLTYFLLQSCWWAGSWLWKRNLLQLLTVLIHGIFFYCLTLSFKLTKHTCKWINIIVAAVVIDFFFYLKKRTELKEADLMENTTPHLKSSPSPSFVVFRFAILGHPNNIRATVPNPDLQIRGGGRGGGSSRPDWGKGEARSQKKFGSATGQFLRACTSPRPVSDRPHHRGLYAPTGFEFEFKFFYVPFQLIKTRRNHLRQDLKSHLSHSLGLDVVQSRK